MRENRQKIFDKYGGRCAYCGCHLGSNFQVDHIVPVFHNDSDEDFERRSTHGKKTKLVVRGSDEESNYNPACIRCNRWKATMSIETFRKEISQQVIRARRESCNFRMAEDFGLIKETGVEVKFYFETPSLLKEGTKTDL